LANKYNNNLDAVTSDIVFLVLFDFDKTLGLHHSFYEGVPSKVDASDEYWHYLRNNLRHAHDTIAVIRALYERPDIKLGIASNCREPELIHDTLSLMFGENNWRDIFPLERIRSGASYKGDLVARAASTVNYKQVYLVDDATGNVEEANAAGLKGIKVDETTNLHLHALCKEFNLDVPLQFNVDPQLPWTLEAALSCLSFYGHKYAVPQPEKQISVIDFAEIEILYQSLSTVADEIALATIEKAKQVLDAFKNSVMHIATSDVEIDNLLRILSDEDLCIYGSDLRAKTEKSPIPQAILEYLSQQNVNVDVFIRLWLQSLKLPASRKHNVLANSLNAKINETFKAQPETAVSELVTFCNEHSKPSELLEFIKIAKSHASDFLTKLSVESISKLHIYFLRNAGEYSALEDDVAELLEDIKYASYRQYRKLYENSYNQEDSTFSLSYWGYGNCMIDDFEDLIFRKFEFTDSKIDLSISKRILSAMDMQNIKNFIEANKSDIRGFSLLKVTADEQGSFSTELAPFLTDNKTLEKLILSGNINNEGLIALGEMLATTSTNHINLQGDFDSEGVVSFAKLLKRNLDILALDSKHLTEEGLIQLFTALKENKVVINTLRINLKSIAPEYVGRIAEALHSTQGVVDNLELITEEPLERQVARKLITEIFNDDISPVQSIELVTSDYEKVTKEQWQEIKQAEKQQRYETLVNTYYREGMWDFSGEIKDKKVFKILTGKIGEWNTQFAISIDSTVLNKELKEDIFAFLKAANKNLTHLTFANADGSTLEMARGYDVPSVTFKGKYIGARLPELPILFDGVREITFESPILGPGSVHQFLRKLKENKKTLDKLHIKIPECTDAYAEFLASALTDNNTIKTFVVESEKPINLDAGRVLLSTYMQTSTSLELPCADENTKAHLLNMERIRGMIPEMKAKIDHLTNANLQKLLTDKLKTAPWQVEKIIDLTSTLDCYCNNLQACKLRLKDYLAAYQQHTIAAGITLFHSHGKPGRLRAEAQYNSWANNNEAINMFFEYLNIEMSDLNQEAIEKSYKQCLQIHSDNALNDIKNYKGNMHKHSYKTYMLAYKMEMDEYCKNVDVQGANKIEFSTVSYKKDGKTLDRAGIALMQPEKFSELQAKTEARIKQEFNSALKL
jgi:hypothetical protein